MSKKLNDPSVTALPDNLLATAKLTTFNPVDGKTYHYPLPSVVKQADLNAVADDVQELQDTAPLNPTVFVVTDGMVTVNAQELAALLAPYLNGLPTPAAPINPVTNDGQDTFGWTDQGGKTYADAQYSANNGMSYQNCTANPQPVGNIAIAPGGLLLRYKANAGVNNASQTLANTVAFTVSGGVGGGAAGTPVTSWVAPTPSSDLTISSNNLTANAANVESTANNATLAIGVAGWVQFKVAKIGGATGFIYLRANGIDYYLGVIGNDVYTLYGGTGITANNDDILRIEVSVSGSTATMICKISTDGGTTFSDVDSSHHPTITMALNVKATFPATGTKLMDVRQNGLS